MKKFDYIRSNIEHIFIKHYLLYSVYCQCLPEWRIAPEPNTQLRRLESKPLQKPPPSVLILAKRKRTLTTTIACYLQSEFHRFIKFERKLYGGVPGGRPRHTEFAALRLSVPGRNYNYEMGWVGLGWVGLCLGCLFACVLKTREKESAWSWKRSGDDGQHHYRQSRTDLSSSLAWLSDGKRHHQQPRDLVRDALWLGQRITLHTLSAQV